MTFVQSKKVVHYKPLRVTDGTSPESDRGNLEGGGDFSGKLRGNALKRNGKSPCFFYGPGISKHTGSRLSRLSLHLETTIGVYALRHHPDMREDRDSGRCHATDETTHRSASFKLNSVSTRLQAGDSIGYCEIITALIASERHIRHHKSIFRSPCHCGNC